MTKSQHELDALLTELDEWLRIPSISTGGGDPQQLRRAAQWVIDRIVASGGSGSLVETKGNPIAVGELKSTRKGAPTILIYGHYDVQGPGDLDLWTSPPFEPAIRDGRLYARGACDDKGNFLPLLHTACELSREGNLEVNVRIMVEGEEETGSTRASDWILADEQGADCVIAFDSLMLDPSTPALTIGTRGLVQSELTVTTGDRDLHSGLYGGVALNAISALHRTLAGVLPDSSGRLPEPLRAGIAVPSEEELAAWESLPTGDELIAAAGGIPADSTAVRDYYLRTLAEPALEVHGVISGAYDHLRTIIPAEASAKLSIRTAPGQDSSEIAKSLELLLQDSLPSGATLEIKTSFAQPALEDPAKPAIELARQALAEACSSAPAVIRLGATLPIFAAFIERGIPTVMSGFALPEDNFHAPDESIALERLQLALQASRALFQKFTRLRSTSPEQSA